jgi:hypothetical protein
MLDHIGIYYHLINNSSFTLGRFWASTSRGEGLYGPPGNQVSRHPLWDGHSNVLLITSEAVFMQRVNYIHQNPVRAGLVKRAEDYRWSSARCWRGVKRESVEAVSQLLCRVAAYRTAHHQRRPMKSSCIGARNQSAVAGLRPTLR